MTMTDEQKIELAAQFGIGSHSGLEFARALLSASKPAVPTGWKLVPVEPTDGMVDAACPVGEVVDHFDMKTALRSALAAAPAAPAQSGEPKEDAISRSKRILALVDTYIERPDRMNRNALRSHLFDEFTEAAGGAPQPSQPAQAGDEPPDGDKEHWRRLYLKERECRQQWQQQALQSADSAVVLDDERAAFEDALPKISPHRENGYDLTRSGPNFSGENYADADIQTQWEIWQARAALPQPVAQTDDARDAARYRAFFDADLSVSFCGVDYFSKADADAAIDAALGAAQPTSGGDHV
nr:hypothetical protein HUO10_003266 [Paraburkholderia busanensis]